MPSHPKRSLTSISGVHKISPSYSLTFLYSVYNLCSHLTFFFFLCLHLTSNVMLSAFSLFLLQFFTGIAQYNRCGWLAGTHRDVFCVAAVGPAGRLCVCACMRVCFDVFSDPATSSTCDILPPESDPAGHSHTQERWRRTHHLNLPVTFRIFACWVLISFFLFFSIFQFPTKNQVTSLSCAFWQHDGMLWLMNQLPSNLVFSVSLFVYFFFLFIGLTAAESLVSEPLLNLIMYNSMKLHPLYCKPS